MVLKVSGEITRGIMFDRREGPRAIPWGSPKIWVVFLNFSCTLELPRDL